MGLASCQIGTPRGSCQRRFLRTNLHNQAYSGEIPSALRHLLHPGCPGRSSMSGFRCDLAVALSQLPQIPGFSSNQLRRSCQPHLTLRPRPCCQLALRTKCRRTALAGRRDPGAPAILKGRRRFRRISLSFSLLYIVCIYLGFALGRVKAKSNQNKSTSLRIHNYCYFYCIYYFDRFDMEI